MTMQMHTPGPWAWFTGKNAVDPSQPHIKFFHGASGQGFAHTVGLAEPEDTANARLIVAAPELLAACRRAVRLLEQKQDEAIVAAALAECQAAIAKAEGR